MKKKAGRPAKSGSSANTRQKILEAAMKIVAKEGFLQLSYPKLAKACKISQPAVLHHYSNREQLFRDMISQVISEARILMSETHQVHDNGATRLKSYVNATLHWAQKRPDLAQLIIYLYYYGTQEKLFADIYRTVREGAQARIQEYLWQCYHEGSLKVKKEKISATASIIHASTIGWAINRLATQENKNPLEEIDDEIDLFFESVLL